MSKRVIIFIGLVALIVSQSDAGNPFDLLLGNKRMATQARRAKPIPAHILRSAEKMTEWFGPSVLIREPAAKTKNSKFVTQPE
jgi:hypothetical protein